ncbi:MAG: hypothetical protein ACI88S_002053, partial [Ilumatobacter sp.]
MPRTEPVVPRTESGLISGGRIDQAAVRVGGPVVMTWP